jgi:hypothetical protein
VHYFFDRKLKLSDPSIFSIFFVSLLEGIYLFGLYYTTCLLVGEREHLPKTYIYSLFAGIVLLNYLLVYRKSRHYDYYSQQLNPYLVIGIILLGYTFMGITGQIYRDVFFGK